MDFVNHVTVLTGLAVMAVQQILKLKVVPLAFANRYPIPTLILLSVVAAILVTLKSAVHPHSLTDWILLVATIGVTAAFTYNHTIKNWSDLRAMEG